MGTSNLRQKLLCLMQMFCGVRLSLSICRLFHDASTVKVTALDTVKEFIMVDIHGHFQTYIVSRYWVKTFKYSIHKFQHYFFFFLGPERMLQMHRSHVGLLCYPRIIQVL